MSMDIKGSHSASHGVSDHLSLSSFDAESLGMDDVSIDNTIHGVDKSVKDTGVPNAFSADVSKDTVELSNDAISALDRLRNHMVDTKQENNTNLGAATQGLSSLIL